MLQRQSGLLTVSVCLLGAGFCFFPVSFTANASSCPPDQTFTTQIPISELEAVELSRKNVTPITCSWKTLSVNVSSSCGIRLIRIMGFGSRPEHVSLFRMSDNVAEQGMETNGPNSLLPRGVTWFVDINRNRNAQLACDPGTCPSSSRLDVQTTNTVRPWVCHQQVHVFIGYRR